MVAAAILAGGQGRRLGGQVKSLMALGDGRRIIDLQLAVLRPLFDALVVVGGVEGQFADLVSGGQPAEVIVDRRGPGWGPLAGLDAALAWLPPHCRSLVCVAGDMPGLAPAVLTRLRDAPESAIAVVPRRGGQPEPLCARYDRSVSAVVAEQLASGNFAMRAFVDRLVRGGGGDGAGSVSWVEEDELRGLDPGLATFSNINTFDDLAAFSSGSRPPGGTAGGGGGAVA